MAKSNKGKVIQMLSPENYIRQKARTLPVYECVVNANWKESKIANLVIARQHTNGNITAGIYLVDLACLGVKDTIWFFNIPVLEYRENLERFMDLGRVDKIDYVLAHNIVYAGIEFAEDYEFKPHKDFTSITQYILDEESDDIPIIEIECGIGGLPAYMQGPLHSDDKAQKVIAHLERVAGPGNYYIMNEDGLVINGEDDSSDEEEDQFAGMSMEEKRNEFVGYYKKKLDQLDNSETGRFLELTESIVEDLLDIDKYDEYIDAFNQELSGIDVDDEFIPDEMLGIEPGGTSLPSEVKEQFFEFMNKDSDLKKIKKQLKSFGKNRGVEAASAYLDLIVAELEGSKVYDALLKTAAEKYPRYGLIQLRWAETKIGAMTSGKGTIIPFPYNTFFQGRDSIHPLEFFDFINLNTLAMAYEMDLDKLEAWKGILYDYQDDGMDIGLLDGFIVMFQVGVVAKRLEIE